MNDKQIYLTFILVSGVLIFGTLFIMNQIQGDGTTMEQINYTTTIGDKEKVYDSSTQTVTFQEALGAKESFGWIKLDTPKEFHVGGGYNMIAQYTCSNSTYCLPKIMDLYDLTDNSKSMSKQIDYKYLSIKTKKVNDYKTECDESISISELEKYLASCKQTLIGSHQEDEWLLFDEKVISSKQITIGLFTTVEVGEKGEWQPTYEVDGTNIKVQEFANWIQDLNTGLQAYYKFDETSGTNLADSVTGNYPATAYGGITVNEAGKIGKSIRLDGSTGYAQINNSINATTDHTVNFWYNPDAVANAVFLNHRQGGNWWLYKQDSSADGQIYLNWGFSTVVATSSQLIDTGRWTMLTFRYNGSHACLFVNGTYQKCTAGTGTMSFPYSWTQIGKGGDGGDFVDGFMDELGFWNRSLSDAEISTNLWNGGNGNTYTNLFYNDCNFTGFAKDSNGNGINNTNILIINQTDNKVYYNLTSDSNGFWSKNITGNGQNYTILFYLNGTLVSKSKHNLNATC